MNKSKTELNAIFSWILVLSILGTGAYYFYDKNHKEDIDTQERLTTFHAINAKYRNQMIKTYNITDSLDETIDNKFSIYYYNLLGKNILLENPDVFDIYKEGKQYYVDLVVSPIMKEYHLKLSINKEVAELISVKKGNFFFCVSLNQIKKQVAGNEYDLYSSSYVAQGIVKAVSYVRN